MTLVSNSRELDRLALRTVAVANMHTDKQTVNEPQSSLPISVLLPCGGKKEL